MLRPQGNLSITLKQSYLDIIQSLLEGESHTTADNQGIDLVKHVLNQLDLI